MRPDFKNVIFKTLGVSSWDSPATGHGRSAGNPDVFGPNVKQPFKSFMLLKWQVFYFINVERVHEFIRLLWSNIKKESKNLANWLVCGVKLQEFVVIIHYLENSLS